MFVLYFCTSGVSARVVLPSFLKRKRQEDSLVTHAKRTKAKPVQIWDRDIICLPKTEKSHSNVSYPRGKYRTKLGQMGLIGKIRLMSTMTEDEMEQEIRSVFKGPMNGRQDFPFVFLQPTGLGSRSLTVPSVSSSFSWSPQQVAKLGGVKSAIYILAADDLVCFPDSEVYTSKNSNQC